MTTTIDGKPVTSQLAVVNVGGPPPTGAVGGGGDAGSLTASNWVPGASTTGASGGKQGSHGSGTSGGSQGSGSGSGGGDGDGTNDGGSSSGGSGGVTAGHHGLSKGAIAGLAILAAVALVVLFVFISRRRSLCKRLARRKHLFRSKEPVSPYKPKGLSSSGYFRNAPPSVRSSFGTTYERDPFYAPFLPPHMIPMGTDWPLYIPTPEMSQTTPSPITAPPAAATTTTLLSPTVRNGNRTSSQSLISFESGSDHGGVPGQVLAIPERAADSDSPLRSEVATPVSVRPFSPTERWSFPMPPPSAASRQSTPHTSMSPVQELQRSTTASSFHTAHEDMDPFTDTSVGAVSADESHTTETFVTVDTLDTETGRSFFNVETAHRPFVPTLRDEFAVTPGDQIRMLKKFDDGWGYADNLTTGTRGLFPIDCLREANQDLPAFLSQADYLLLD